MGLPDAVVFAAPPSAARGGACGDGAAVGAGRGRSLDDAATRVAADARAAARRARAPAPRASTTALPAAPACVVTGPARARPAPQRLSYSQLTDYAKCGYRFYLSRVLRLPDVDAAAARGRAGGRAGIDPRDARHRSSTARSRTSTSTRPQRPRRGRDPRSPTTTASRSPTSEVEDVQRASCRRSPTHRCASASPRASSVTREAGFAFALEPDGSRPARPRHRRRLRATSATARIWSSTTRPTTSPRTRRRSEYIARNYETQRLVYALAALRDGAPEVEVAYCLLERPAEPVTTRLHARQDAPELADALAQLAHGVLDPRTIRSRRRPHRELCGDCPGRHALCSHPQSVTLRPPPAPWPGAPARRTSPAGASRAAGRRPRSARRRTAARRS